ncbi:hypothetical protein [Photobacterium sanguinicancri]|uniref:hypothetical protein n=1 Tax=Photobacterium sanguinicancri TaxID=875932 RepID=UPI003D14C07E
MAIKQAPTLKDVIYNGTHGNLSVAIGKVPQGVFAATDVIELLKLDAGVKLVDLTLVVTNVDAKAASATVEAEIKPKGKTAIKVSDLDLKAVGDQRAEGWFPKELYDVPCTLQLKVTGAFKADDEVYFKAFTTSVGSL